MTRMTDYQTLCGKLSALMDGVPHRIANLANASALLYAELEDLNWAGFYFLEGGKLVLGPFQGKPACIEIEVGKGVCGTAVQEERTQLVPDVHLFPGHIACDSASNSEIVAKAQRLHGAQVHQGVVADALKATGQGEVPDVPVVPVRRFRPAEDQHVLPRGARSSMGKRPVGERRDRQAEERIRQHRVLIAGERPQDRDGRGLTAHGEPPVC